MKFDDSSTLNQNSNTGFRSLPAFLARHATVDREDHNREQYRSVARAVACRFRPGYLAHYAQSNPGLTAHTLQNISGPPVPIVNKIGNFDPTELRARSKWRPGLSRPPSMPGANRRV